MFKQPLLKLYIYIISYILYILPLLTILPQLMETPYCHKVTKSRCHIFGKLLKKNLVISDICCIFATEMVAYCHHK